ncbi:molybdopterin molybdenumtransferase MoeA [Desulfovibrio desulfuricans]|nr:molybdopterin molybdenumtransferase MoeA [Desulfovibrio desulfuricans]
MSMQQRFFRVLTVSELVALLRTCAPLGAECPTAGRSDSLPVEDAASLDSSDASTSLESSGSLDSLDGRVLAKAVVARENLPATHRAAMDGYAVRAADLFGASEGSPAYLDVVGHSAIDARPDVTLGPGQCLGIVTGGTLPEGADAVLMVEYAHDLGGGAIEAHRPVAPWENVMLRAEDAEEGRVVLPAGTLLRPQEVGLLAALGETAPLVHRRPRVAVISTGDELVPADATPRDGQIRDVNTHTLACLVRRAGAVPRCMGLVPDVLPALEAALRQGLETADVVLLSGGSSVGVRDLTVAALERIEGAELLCHGVAISPGKPLIVARVGEKLVWGLPGQVTSAQVVMHVLGMPFLRHLAGWQDAFDMSRWPSRRAVLARNTATRQGREDYIRVRLDPRPDDLPEAVPLFGKSGLLKTLVGSDGVVRIPAEVEGLERGALVDVLLFGER